MTGKDAEYNALRAKVREVGHLSELSPFIDFLAMSPGQDWLDLKWGGTSVRLEISEDAIRIIGPVLEVTHDAINSITVRRKPAPSSPTT